MKSIKPHPADYAPYDTIPHFWFGYDAYGRTWDNPYDGVAAQAWDRGLEYAARRKRWLDNQDETR